MMLYDNQTADPFTTDVNNAVVTSLCEACKEGDLELVQEILEEGPSLGDDEVDESYWAPLHHAIYGGHLEVVQYLVETRGDDVNSLNDTDEGQEALQFAATDGHLEVVKYLAERGEECILDTGNESNRRPIHFASLGGHFDMVRFLIEGCNVTVDCTDEDNWSTLHYACMGGDLEMVRFLAEKYKLDCNATGVDGWGPLHCAASNGHTVIVQYLVEEPEAAADVLVGDEDENLLHLAVKEGHLNTAKYLVEECGFRAVETTSDGDTALHLAARYGQLSIIKYFANDNNHDDRCILVAALNTSEQTAYDIAAKCVETGDMYADLEVVGCLSTFVDPSDSPSMPPIPSRDEIALIGDVNGSQEHLE